MVKAIAEHDYVSVRSGQKVGKSSVAACLAIWWAVTRPRGFVILTAPTYAQISIIWREVRTLVAGAKIKLAEEEPSIQPSTGWSLGPKRGIFGRSTDKPTNMQGLSGDQMFYVIDEAAGYAEAILDAIKGNLAGGGKMLMISNPNECSGGFYRSHTDQQHLWKTLHIRSTDTPNFHGGNVPGLANPEWLQRQKEDWGEESPAYDVRALGEFPKNSANTIVSLSILKASQEKTLYDTTPEDGPLEFGVDVARFGDDEFVICPRRGRKVMPSFATSGLDVPQKVGHIVRMVKDLARPGEKPKVKVDSIGEGGGVVDLLNLNHKAVLEAIGINVAEKSDDEERYSNLRTQLLFGVSQFLREGGVLPDDAKLGGDLVATNYEYDSRGRYKAEAKDDVRKRLKRSPDRGDALALAIYNGRTRTARRIVGAVGDSAISPEDRTVG